MLLVIDYEDKRVEVEVSYRRNYGYTAEAAVDLETGVALNEEDVREIDMHYLIQYETELHELLNGV